MQVLHSISNTNIPRLDVMDEILFPMFLPHPNMVAQVLQNGLMSNFEKVTVEWVPCPDLTLAPFYLAAPGLCGSEEIVQIGGTGYMFPHMQRTMSISIKELVTKYRYAWKDNFIIGGCICPHPLNGTLGELNTDISFLIKNGVQMHINRCRLTFWNIQKGCCTESEPLPLNSIICTMLGNFFISEGKKGMVLKIQAKNRTGLEFIDAMQFALSQAFGDNFLSQQCVGLGGVFLVSNSRLRNHIIPNSWNGLMTTRQDIFSRLYFFDIYTPAIGVGTFLNTDRMLLRSHRLRPLWCTKKQFHTINNYGQGGYYHKNVESSNCVEYLGYFNVAQFMRCIATNINSLLQEFSLLKSDC